MADEMLGVVFDKIENNPIIDSDHSDFYVPFEKTLDYFESYENKVNFIKACESLVRKHKFYKTYISYLVNVIGMNTCQVIPGVECSVDEKGKAKSKVTIEMHHGPILTLFDTCEIVLNHLIATEYPGITTFKVANIVIEEHRLNNVRVIMLAKTVHQEVHNMNIMLNYNMGFGNTYEFLNKYSDGLDRAMKKKINDYIEWSKENDSFDNHVLEIATSMERYENDFDEFDDAVGTITA